MKVCLIIPPSGFLLDERVFPSLGVLKVAAVLEQAGIDVHVCDLSGCQDLPTTVRRHLDHCDATHYGVTSTTPQMPAAAEIVKLLRKHKPFASTILGGPHATMINAAAKRDVARAIDMRRELYDNFDTVVAGDGERAMFDALGAHVQLVDADDMKSSLFLQPFDLVDPPFPARHLLDLDSYHYEVDGQRATSLIAQLGCPFGCGFCGGRSSPSFRRIRIRPTVSVVAELVWLYQTYGYTGFMFYDDELNVSKAFPELLRALIAAQQQLGVKWALRGFVKSELLTNEQAGLMAEAGFRTLLVGFESGSERILRNIQKRATVEENTRCVDLLHQNGLRVKALMSVGHPGESDETVSQTQRWLLEVRPDEFDVSAITVYPGTPYFDEAQEERPNIWTYRAPKTEDAIHARPFLQFQDTLYYKGVSGRYESFVHTDALSEVGLVHARDWLEDSVRDALKIPYPAALTYDHSMGQHAL